jgi:hypothetical protein
MIKTLLREEFRLLTFRPVSSAVAAHWREFLLFGLLFTCLAGIGRYWDNPRAHLWQYMGLGSLIYVFVLAFVIWAMLIALKPKNWSYRNVLLFVTLTSPPAILYAIPVERFMSREAAVSANVWFLAIVAIWRLGLYAVFLRRTARLSVGAVIVGTLFPITIIIVALAILNLEHVVFNLMSGIREDERSVNDGAYGFVLTLSLFSILLAPILAIAYGILVNRAWRNS